MSSIPKEVTLWNGQKMPIIGFGTFNIVLEDEVHAAVEAALEAGYRHIDTAYGYGNEAAVGRVLKKWLDQEKINREDLFITTKLPVQGMHPERVKKYLNQSLAALQLSYVDLYLIHYPCGCVEKEGELLPLDENAEFLIDPTTDLISVWQAMEEQVDTGRARAIGLSNCNARQVKRIAKAARTPPAVLQVELHAYFQQRELVPFCRALDIAVSAYAPLGSAGFLQLIDDTDSDMTCLPKISPLLDPVVVEIAQKHKKKPAQIVLHHIAQRGIISTPKSVNPARIKENIQIFDFELDEDDIWELDSLDRWNKGRMFDLSIFRGTDKHPEFPFKDAY